MILKSKYLTWRTIYLKLLIRISSISFPNIFQKLEFILCKAERQPQGMELQQIEDDEKFIGKLFRKNTKTNGVY